MTRDEGVADIKVFTDRSSFNKYLSGKFAEFLEENDYEPAPEVRTVEDIDEHEHSDEFYDWITVYKSKF
jgi:hypothetical protein